MNEETFNLKFLAISSIKPVVFSFFPQWRPFSRSFFGLYL